MYKRVHTLDAVYRQRWDQVQPEGSNAPLGVDPRPWTELVSEEDARAARWYTEDDLNRAVQRAGALR
jgi:hypothetical protein